jgi:4-amino-4-deoxy-L-arabinose transferase-like glycosyltransferase
MSSTLCGLAVVVLIGLLTCRIAGDLAGVVAAAIAAVHPLIWINDLMLLTEGLYQVLVVVVLWTAYDWIERPDRRRAAVIGAAIAFAALTRGEAVALFAFLVLPLVLRARTVDRGEKVRQIAVCWVAGLAVMAPWITWNMVRFEEPVLISSSTGAVLMAGSCDEVWSGERMGLWDDCFSARELWDEFDAEFPGAFLTRDDLVIYDESVRDNWDRRQATEYILDNWTRYPTVAAARIGRSLELFRVSHTLRKNYQLEGRWAEPSTVGLGIYYGLVPLAVIGALVLRRSGRRLSPLLAMWATVMFASATAFGLTRYRVPVDLAMIVLGATAISWLWERLRTPDRGVSI